MHWYQGYSEVANIRNDPWYNSQVVKGVVVSQGDSEPYQWPYWHGTNAPIHGSDVQRAYWHGGDLSNLLTTLSPLIKQQQDAAIKRLSGGGRISRDISALQSFCIIAVSGFPDSRASEGVVIRIARAGNQFWSIWGHWRAFAIREEARWRSSTLGGQGTNKETGGRSLRLHFAQSVASVGVSICEENKRTEIYPRKKNYLSKKSMMLESCFLPLLDHQQATSKRFPNMTPLRWMGVLESGESL